MFKLVLSFCIYFCGKRILRCLLRIIWEQYHPAHLAFVFVYLCICVFVYLCICVFMYLYLYLYIQTYSRLPPAHYLGTISSSSSCPDLQLCPFQRTTCWRSKSLFLGICAAHSPLFRRLMKQSRGYARAPVASFKEKWRYEMQGLPILVGQHKPWSWTQFWFTDNGIECAEPQKAMASGWSRRGQLLWMGRAQEPFKGVLFPHLPFQWQCLSVKGEQTIKSHTKGVEEEASMGG